MSPFFAYIIPVPAGPGGGPQPPLGTWGPGDGRPTNPIQLPPWAGGPQPGWPPVGGEPPRPWDPAYPSNPIPIYPGGSPQPPAWWPGHLPPTGGRPQPPYIDNSLPTPPVWIPPGLPGGDGRDYSILIMPNSPPISLNPGPGPKPEVPEGGSAVLIWNGAWVWKVIPPVPPGYNPPPGGAVPVPVA